MWDVAEKAADSSVSVRLATSTKNNYIECCPKWMFNNRLLNG